MYIVNHKPIKMKKIFVFLFSLLFALSYSQYAVVDFINLNAGTDADYHSLEKVWKVYHQKSIDKGEKTGWAVWKKTPMNAEYYDQEAQYVVINQFASKEQLENWTKNFNYENAVATMKNGLKGKMSSSAVNKILTKGSTIKKEVRIYQLQILNATPFTGGDLKIGDKMTFSPMSQKTEDYEQVESFIAKPYFLHQVMNGKHRWWGFTKVIDRNENAYESVSHIAWNIPIPNLEHDEYMVANEFVQKVLEDKISTSREMINSQELTLVYKND